MTEEVQNQGKWKENVILVDADYVDSVAFNLIVNFERMLGRPIPMADMSLWVDCVALDGGLAPGENETQVVLIHSKDKERLENIAPSDFADELTGRAFKDHVGEFIFDAYPVEEDIVDFDDFYVDALHLITSQKEVKRVMVIPNAENAPLYNKVRALLNSLEDDDKHITLFAMRPMPGGRFQQQILGYSLMVALGISGDEIKDKTIN